MQHYFTVAVPTDNGFIGRQCKSSDCSKYFKVHKESLSESMSCPYCGETFSKVDLLTSDQEDYLREVAYEKGREIVVNELNKMFSDIARKSKNLSFKGSPYHPKPISPAYTEKKVDSEISCSKCTTLFQVYGIFGFCPGCKYENTQIYDANFEIIMNELRQSGNSNRSLRHAYSDIVSTFQIVAQKHVSKEHHTNTNFQDIYETRRLFKKMHGVDIMQDLDDSEQLTLKRIFQKRHAYIHSNGVIDEKYVKKVPEDSKYLGQQADLSIEEFDKGVESLRRVILKLIKSAT